MCLDDLECKINLFRNFNKIKELDPKKATDGNEHGLSEDEIKELKEVNISHDMTKQQREEDKKLRAEAKNFKNKARGNTSSG